MNDGSFDVLTGFACYLAAIVVFRVFFAAIYIVKWQWRYAFNENYQIPQVNLEAVFKKYKKAAVTGEDSTDDEKILAQAKEIYKKNKK